MVSWYRFEVFWMERADEPPTNVYETPDALVVELALPGIPREAIEIVLEGRVLRVSTGERHLPPLRRFLRMGIPTGPFHFEMKIPGGYDLEGIQSHLRDGILRLVIPRRPPIQIPVQEGESHGGSS